MEDEERSGEEGGGSRPSPLPGLHEMLRQASDVRIILTSEKPCPQLEGDCVVIKVRRVEKRESVEAFLPTQCVHTVP